MFEITTNDSERFEAFQDEGKAYENGKYDFTFENRFLIYHCEMTHELHYIAIDMTTGLSSEMCRRKKNCEVSSEEFTSLIPSLFNSIKYTGERRYPNSMNANPTQLIDSIFRVILPKYGYNIREEQIKLAKMMYRGLTQKQISLNEAEVGTGKTLAFLVASFVAKYTDKDSDCEKPITITTSNIELQTALVEKEIPMFSKCLMDYHIIDEPLVAVLRKGKEHYFCKRRFNDFLQTIKRTPTKYANLIFAFEKSDFDKKAFDLDKIKMRPSVKSRICVKTSCKKCPYAQDCKYRSFMKWATQNDIVDYQVTNHNLYLTSQRLRSEADGSDAILLSSDFVIVDEAHKLKETAIEVFGSRLSENDIPAFVKSAFTHCKAEGSHKFYHEWLDRLLKLNAEFFFHMKSCYSKLDHDDDQGTLIELKQEDYNMMVEMEELIFQVEKNCKELSVHSNMIRLLKTSLKTFRRTNNLNIWIEADENNLLSVCCTPKNIGAVLFNSVWNKNCSHVLTSGTMSDGTDFAFFMKENGIDRIPNRLLNTTCSPSPFDYQNHTRLYIPKCMPFPDTENEEYIQAIADQVVDLVKATHGHTAVLFTSYKVLNSVYELTKERISEFDIFCMTRSNRNAIGDFKKSKNGVIFASGTMWEGVDCIGDTLSSVIIVKLPFPRRSAVMEQKKEETGDVHEFIRRYATPEMLIKLRQGIGRLIRSENDTGLITILDSRAAEGEHSKRLKKVLEKYPSIETIDQIEAWFRQTKPKSYFAEVKE